jgi:hypothetical protein
MLTATLALLLTAQSPTAADIVVTAARQTDTATVQRYVREVSPTANGQLATMRDPVCPAVFGLPGEYGQRVVRRIRAIAGQAGMEVAPEGCSPNVTLIVANNSVRAIQEMQRQRPRLFYGLPEGEYRRLTAGNDPVRMWSLTEVRNEDGSDFSTGTNADNRRGGTGGPNMDNTLRVRSSSILNLPTERIITQSIIVMEEGATVGKSLAQIADYVAVRAITGARDETRAGRGNSILTLFEDGAQAPRTLTALDMAYLRAMHSTRGNQRAASHLNRLAQRIAGELNPSN